MKRFDHRRYRPAPTPSLNDRQWPDNALTQAPRWASVDLRDGNQALLEPMDVMQKRRLWGLLVDLGFKEIEIGFPSASKADYDFTRWLIEADQIPEDVTVQVLVQARPHLVERTFEALHGVRRAIVHVYNSTSTVQRERVFETDHAGIQAIAAEGARLVKEGAARHPGTDWVFQYSPESFSNTEWDFAVSVCDAVTDVWQPTPERPCIINLPATVESSTPNLFADQVEYFCRHVKRRDALIVSLHTHNDRGCAVAAAELGLMAGADRVEGTLLGNGERTGNMDIVTLAMNLYSQGIDPGLDLSNPDRIVETYTACTGLPVHPRHPWIGELVYTAFSGSHQDAIRKCLRQQSDDEPWQVAYLPIDPRDIGRDYQAVIRVNSQSGKGGIAFVLERDYGLQLPRWLQIELAQRVQAHTDAAAGEVDSARIHALFLTHFADPGSPVRLDGYRLERNRNNDRIEIDLFLAGRRQTLHGSGEGAIEAFVDAWQLATGNRVSVVDYSEHALTAGTEAEAVAYTQLSVDGERVTGVAFDRDTVGASLNAMVAALNRATSVRAAA
jgi:2-isopropylmalate synthase